MAEVKTKPPVKAIREYCVEHCMLSPKGVRTCTILCPLHPYRLGTNPNRAGKGGNPNLNRGKRQRQPAHVESPVGPSPNGNGDLSEISNDALVEALAERLKGARDG